MMTVTSVIIDQNDQAQDWQGSLEDDSAVLMYLQVEGSLRWLRLGIQQEEMKNELPRWSQNRKREMQDPTQWQNHTIKW